MRALTGGPAPTRPTRLGAGLAGLLGRLERARALDVAVGPMREAGRAVLDSDRLRDLLSGTALGHPAHPMLVDLPIGFWTSAMALDFTGRRQRPAARRLVGLGVLCALPTVASGLSDWIDTEGPPARVGLVHAAANATAVTCYTMSWWTRRRGGNAGQLWALTGATVATVGGWLGGHLAYTLGVGVDTNAFDAGPPEWTAVVGDPSEDDAPDGSRSGTSGSPPCGPRTACTRWPIGAATGADRSPKGVGWATASPARGTGAGSHWPAGCR